MRNNMNTSTIYPEGMKLMNCDQKRPVCVGKGWGCDRQFQPINPRETLQNELFKRVEVPSCLNARQYIDVIQASTPEQ